MISMPEKTAVNKMPMEMMPGAEELDVIAVSRFREGGAESKTHGHQEQQRLAERSDDTRAGPHVTLELPQGEDIDDSH